MNTTEKNSEKTTHNAHQHYSEEALEQQLHMHSQTLDDLLNSDGSLSSYLKLSVASNFGWLAKIAYIMAILLTFLLFYTGYQFFTAGVNAQVFWGVCFIVSFQAQVATKLWIFMQANRNHLSRELRLIALKQAT